MGEQTYERRIRDLRQRYSGTGCDTVDNAAAIAAEADAEISRLRKALSLIEGCDVVGFAMQSSVRSIARRALKQRKRP